jgi:hypothetical protein
MSRRRKAGRVPSSRGVSPDRLPGMRGSRQLGLGRGMKFFQLLAKARQGIAVTATPPAAEKREHFRLSDQCRTVDTVTSLAWPSWQVFDALRSPPRRWGSRADRVQLSCVSMSCAVAAIRKVEPCSLP